MTGLSCDVASTHRTAVQDFAIGLTCTNYKGQSYEMIAMAKPEILVPYSGGLVIFPRRGGLLHLTSRVVSKDPVARLSDRGGLGAQSIVHSV